jgi:hypothetical protein
MDFYQLLGTQRPPSYLAPSEADYGVGMGDDFHYDAAGGPNDVGFDRGTIEEQEQSALAALKRSSQQRKDGFLDHLAFFEASRAQEPPPTPASCPSN